MARCQCCDSHWLLPSKVGPGSSLANFDVFFTMLKMWQFPRFSKFLRHPQKESTQRVFSLEFYNSLNYPVNLSISARIHSLSDPWIVKSCISVDPSTLQTTNTVYEVETPFFKATKLIQDKKKKKTGCQGTGLIDSFVLNLVVVLVLNPARKFPPVKME